VVEAYRKIATADPVWANDFVIHTPTSVVFLVNSIDRMGSDIFGERRREKSIVLQRQSIPLYSHRLYSSCIGRLTQYTHIDVFGDSYYPNNSFRKREESKRTKEISRYPQKRYCQCNSHTIYHQMQLFILKFYPETQHFSFHQNSWSGVERSRQK
jgi:hypothetical protein